MSKETVIKDGKIYVRLVNEYEVGNEDEILQSCLKEDHYFIQPFANPPIVPWTDEHYVMLTPNRSRVNYIHKINKFPLCGAYLYRIQGHEYYQLAFSPNREVRNFLEEARNTGSSYAIGGTEYAPVPTNFAWTTGAATKYDFFIMTTVVIDNITSAQNAQFFAIPKEGARRPRTPDFPNIFPEGRICTGSDYNHIYYGAQQSTLPLALAKQLMDNLRVSESNRDLFHADRVRNWMKFAVDGQALTVNETNIEGYNLSTNECVLEFANFYTNKP